MDKENLDKIHDKCFCNKEILLKVDKCGCFNCGRIFNPVEIEEWISFGEDEEPTAFCPYCHIDTIIPDSKEYPVTPELLKDVYRFIHKMD